MTGQSGTNCRSLPGRSLAVALAALALAGVAGCGRHGKAAPQGGSDVPPSQVKLKRNVELGQARKQGIDYVVETVGYLEAEGVTDIAAGVTGIVDEVHFREGHWVTPETVLVKVDQRRYQAGYDFASANEKRAENNLALARELSEIYRKTGTATSLEERAKVFNGLRVAESELVAARNTRVLAEHNLHRSQVRAPYPGQMNQRKVTPGMYLEEKTVIGTIADLSRLRLVGWVPEKAAPTVLDLMAKQQRLRAVHLAGAWLSGLPPLYSGVPAQGIDSQGGLPLEFGLEFTLLPFPKRVFYGRIFFLSTVASPDTHMFECKAEVNKVGLDVDLKPGLTAQIKVPLRGSPSACVVPEESLRASERGFIAFVPVPQLDSQGKPMKDKDGKTMYIAKARAVEPGYRSPGWQEGHRVPVWVEVLKGINPGEWIVQTGAEALEDGTPIAIPEEQLKQLEASR